jgi:hypothetical protein
LYQCSKHTGLASLSNKGISERTLNCGNFDTNDT